MLILVAVGVMNVAAMVGLAARGADREDLALGAGWPGGWQARSRWASRWP